MINVKSGREWCFLFCFVVKMYDYVYIYRVVGVKFRISDVGFVV